jgi:hypothetical protein
MPSFKELQDLAQNASVVTRDNASGLDAVRANIYDLAMHGFLSQVLTLGRLTRVVQALQSGIEDSTNHAPSTDVFIEAIYKREAYRGLCTAATEGLTAAGLAHAQLRRLSGKRLSSKFSIALADLGRKYKQQLDQVNIAADWSSNRAITLQQSLWFDKLLYFDEPSLKQESTSAMPWSSMFFQACGYEEKTAKSHVESSLMLLGLITSGALVRIPTSDATGAAGPFTPPSSPDA